LAGTNPSSLGKNVDIQEKFVAAGCHNYRTEAVPIPLALLHKPFAEFLDNLEHIELSERDMLFTIDVCRKMSRHFVLEKQRESEFAQLLRESIRSLLGATWQKFSTFIQSIPGRPETDLRLTLEVSELF
jgi:hypothetical protein